MKIKLKSDTGNTYQMSILLHADGTVAKILLSTHRKTPKNVVKFIFIRYLLCDVFT